MAKKGYFITSDGKTAAVPEESIQSAIEAGWTPASREQVDAYKSKLAAGAAPKPYEDTNEVMTAESRMPEDVVEKKGAEVVGGALQPMEGEPSPSEAEFGGPVQSTMAAIENFADGLLFNIPGALAGAVDPGYAQRAKLRKEASPVAATTSEIAGAVLPAVGTLGTSLLPSLATKAPRIYSALKVASEMDIGSKALGAVTTKLVTGQAPKEVARLVAPIARNRVENAALLAGRAVTKEAIEQETIRVAEDIVVDRLKGVGAKPEVIASVKRYIKNAAIAGGGQALAGAVFGGLNNGLGAVKNAEALGEDVAPAFWNGMKEGAERGAIVGTAVGFGVPALLKVGQYGLQGINKATQFVGKKILPKAAEKVSPAKGAEVTAALEAGGKMVREDATDATDRIADAFNTEIANGQRLFNALQDYFPKYPAPAMGGRIQAYLLGAGPNSGAALASAEQAFRKKWMTKTKDGITTIDKDKLRAYLKNAPVVDGVIQLPPEYVKLTEQQAAFYDFVDSYTKNADGGLASRAEMILEDTIGETAEPAFTTLQKARSQIDYGKALDALRESVGDKALGARAAKIAIGASMTPGAIGRIIDAGLDPAAILASGGASLVGGTVLAKGAESLLDPVAGVQNLVELDRFARKSTDFANNWSARWVGTRTGIAGTQVGRRVGIEITEPQGERLSTMRDQYVKEKKKIETLSVPDEANKVFDETFQGLGDFSPELAERTRQVAAAGVGFLADKLPKAPKNWVVNKPWEPTTQQMRQYLQYSKYVKNPDSVLEDAEEKGYVPPEGLEVLQKLYPNRLTGIQYSLIDQLATAQKEGLTVDTKRRAVIDKLMGRRTDNMSLQELKRMQDAMATPQQKGRVPQQKTNRPALEATPTQDIP